MKEGSFVNVHLVEPVERLWGRLYRLDPSGIIIRGVDVKQVESFKYQFRSKEKTVFPQTFFFPMRRVLKLDMDEALDQVPSIIESFVEITGLSEDEIIEMD